jgi:hypothetical protein
VIQQVRVEHHRAHDFGSELARLRADLGMVSVVVSIRMRKMFVDMRNMFLNARDAEQDVRERQASENF